MQSERFFAGSSFIRQKGIEALTLVSRLSPNSILRVNTIKMIDDKIANKDYLSAIEQLSLIGPPEALSRLDILLHNDDAKVVNSAAVALTMLTRTSSNLNSKAADTEKYLNDHNLNELVKYNFQ